MRCACHGWCARNVFVELGGRRQRKAEAAVVESGSAEAGRGGALGGGDDGEEAANEGSAHLGVGGEPEDQGRLEELAPMVLPVGAERRAVALAHAVSSARALATARRSGRWRCPRRAAPRRPASCTPRGSASARTRRLGDSPLHVLVELVRPREVRTVCSFLSARRGISCRLKWGPDAEWMALGACRKAVGRLDLVVEPRVGGEHAEEELGVAEPPPQQAGVLVQGAVPVDVGGLVLEGDHELAQRGRMANDVREGRPHGLPLARLAVGHGHEQLPLGLVLALAP